MKFSYEGDMMKNVRQFVVRQLQLGALQDIAMVIVAVVLMYTFSFICVVMIRDNISRNSSNIFLSNYPILYGVGGFFISYYAASNLCKLRLTLKTKSKSWIRFDIAMKVLGLFSYDELYIFAKSKSIKLYIADSTINEHTGDEICGRVYTLMNSLMHSSRDITRYVDDKRAYFDKDEFDSAVNELLRSFQVAERSEHEAEHLTLREEIDKLSSENKQLNAELWKVSGNFSAVTARAGKAEQGWRDEQELTKMAVRVAVGLARRCPEGGMDTNKQIQLEIANVLAHEIDLHDFFKQYGDPPKRFEETVRDGLPPKMRKGRGKPKNCPF